MTCESNELWLTYHQASRATKPVTAQLVELNLENHKLSDLEDVLEHVFREGFVDAKYRTCTWWEKKSGCKLKGSTCVDELFEEGVGRCQDSALKLVIQDIPSAMWFTYVHAHNPCAPAVVQRVKTDSTEFKCEKLAHVTNYIFSKGYLLNRVRAYVHWERSCGTAICEDSSILGVFENGQGVCEDKPLRLVIDEPVCEPVGHHHLHGHQCPCQPRAQPVHDCHCRASAGYSDHHRCCGCN